MKPDRKNFSQILRVESGCKPNLSGRAAESTFKWSRDKARDCTEINLKKLEELQYQLYADGSKSMLIVLQGIDTSGKDGVIRKVFTAFNPQGTHVTSFKAPVGREMMHDFLWRTHAALPVCGTVGIFNRSYYEDLIVPMLNDSFSRSQLTDRAEHIKNFEKMLTDEGTTVLKFLLHISKDEQWERLMERLDEPNRNWKFRMGDLAERKRWEKYMTTFSKMISMTSTSYAPWYVVPANSKWFRDFAVSEVVRSSLQAMNLKWPKPSADINLARSQLKRLK